ncbi:hypothetical protein [Psychromonas sp.]|uniref:hypothetical protein n=1 Tax=Psychromonas sp. TaxID=1884585 RepID=UPI003569ED40
MNTINKGRWISVGLVFLLGLSACATSHTSTPIVAAMQYLPEQGEHLINRHAPVFLIEEYLTAHNRIGAVRAGSEGSIWIDPDTPILYTEQRQFFTAKAKYTNLIYRIHFSKVPAGFSPFYLTAGKNVGLIVVITLSPDGLPLLYTMVHTCGCYLAFIPTSNLPAHAYPNNWKAGHQTVFGETLPTALNYAALLPDKQQVQIRIRPDTHRIMDVWLASEETRAKSVITASLQPLSNLKHLQTGTGQRISFYEDSGARAGYVKGSFKSRERWLMSWWTMDWRIGQDKYLGAHKHDGPVFYTSLKPWARNASDMRDFAGFLKYWGWGL